MRQKSSEKMEQILRFVNAYYKEHLRMPSTAEIGEAVRLSKSNVYHYLMSLQEQGVIRYSEGVIETRISGKYRKGRVIAAQVGAVRCGEPEYAEEHIEAYYELPEEIFGKGEFYLLEARGDSMEGAGIEEGDLVVVCKAHTAQSGDVVVALLDGENTLKRYEARDGKVLLHPENPAYEDIFIGDGQDFYIQGIATHVIKRLESSLSRIE